MEKPKPYVVSKRLTVGMVLFIIYVAACETNVMKSSILAVPPFPGLRRFPDGRDFSQWTGNDSKALMKVSN